MTEEADEDWLPELMLLEDYNGDWGAYIEAVYEAFALDFIVSVPAIEGKRFSLKRHPELQGKSATFWHVTSEGKDENQRTPDLRRCERIRWPRAMIREMGTERVRVWRQERVNRSGVLEERIAVALPDFSYLLILADRGDHVLLWTAFLIQFESERRKYEREYKNYHARKG